MKVPYVDLAVDDPQLENELIDSVRRVLRHGQFILGPEVAEFERSFADLCGVRHAVGVNSGTDALVLALRALEIGAGDEVITAPNSFVGTASAIVLAGATPVFVDVADDYNIDPTLIPAAVTSRTKAIMPVHLTGRPADMDAINAIADDNGLLVIEDAAQAVLAELNGRKVGSMGTIGCFSMHPLKNLGACGDAGVITTNDESVYGKLLWMRNIGLVSRENARDWSGNSRLDTLHASMLTAKLRYLNDWTEKRRVNADNYTRELANVGGIRLPPRRKREVEVYHTFVVQAERRDDLKAFLAERGVGTAIHYPTPIHFQSAALKLGYQRGDFPVTESQATRIISLPISQGLSIREQHYVIDQIKTFYATA